MKKNKILFMIGLVLITITIGVSFGYFLLGITVSGSGALSSGKTAKLLHILYDGGESKLEGNNLKPGDTVSKTFSVTITPGSDTNEAIYAIILKFEENGFVKCDDNNYNAELFTETTNACTKGAAELVYKLIEIDGDQENVIVEEGDLTGLTGDVRLAKITKTVDTEKTFNYRLEITFKNLDTDQNHNKNKSLSGNIDVEFAGEYDSPAEETLAKLGQHSLGPIGPITDTACGSCGMEQNGVYEAGNDDDGPSYVFRGTVTNNWVKFANKLWRIIRINGDGSIRLIYAGESSDKVGSKGNGTNALTDQAYNNEYGDNTYVGFTNAATIEEASVTTDDYEQARTGSNPSDILGALNGWYTSNLQSFEGKLEKEAGFCNDRQLSQNTHGSDSYTNEGFGNKPTWYAPLDRVAASTSSSNYASVGSEQKPTLKCGSTTDDFNKDYYTTSDSARGNQKLEHPIGLITMDEVIFAGGFAGQKNEGYWLYTGEYYWTMSPRYATNAHVFSVYADGSLAYGNVSSTYGVRPVINLKANTTFTFHDSTSATKGTVTNPYEVVK